MSSEKRDRPDSAGSTMALLVADTDETQAYVFESNKLPEIRGASRQLDELNFQIGEKVRLAGGKLIYAGGGSLLALVNPEKAADLVMEIEAAFPLETIVATVSAGYRELPADYAAHSFGEYVQWAGHWLRRHKESKAAPPFVETLPHEVTCLSCQVRPANGAYLEQMPDWPICTVCNKKRLAGMRRSWKRESWYDRFDTWLAKQKPVVGDSYYKDHKRQDVDIPQTVSEIGQTRGGRSGYVGFLYLDGDRIGRLLTRMGKEADFKRLSAALEMATQEAVFGALARELAVSEVEGDELRGEIGQRSKVGKQVAIHPFEIITIGGDDVLLLVPAFAALGVARQIGESFAQAISPLVRDLLREREAEVTMSAGVVIAGDHTPVRMLYELSKQLIKEAKKAGGSLDFHILKSADMVDSSIESVRLQYPYYHENQGDRNKDLRLLGRPYRYKQMRTLWDGLQDLKAANFPSSQMKLLAQSLLEGRREATLFYLYQYQRNKKRYRQAYAILEDALAALQVAESRDPPPWHTVQGEKYSHQTVLWDLAELFDFAPVGGKNGDN